MELKKRIELALESIRPYLKTDGGDVKLLEVTKDKIARIELLGACGACPMSSMTFKAGIEEAIKRSVPEIRKVEAINITTSDAPRAELPENLK
ncbi:MAG: NifU family protein [Cyclobacteriaceae bacterium]|nr:NifU family protein [Cyclobacteriaceae bacterium]